MNADAERIIGIYARHGDAFDRQRSRALFERRWLDRFVSALPRPDPAPPSVLDLGCGCGEPLAGYVIGAGCTVTGVDTAPGLIALCRSRFPGHTWLERDMRRLALGRRFAGVLAWDSFFHLDPGDQRAMFAVFRDHLVDGGLLLFTSGPDEGVSIGVFEGEPLYHASLSQQGYRTLLAACNFEVLKLRVEDPDCAGHTVWLARAQSVDE